MCMHTHTHYINSIYCNMHNSIYCIRVQHLRVGLRLQRDAAGWAKGWARWDANLAKQTVIIIIIISSSSSSTVIIAVLLLE